MAKLTDKLFNRVIEGELEFGEAEKSQIAKIAEEAGGGTKLYLHTISGLVNSPLYTFYLYRTSPEPLTNDSVMTDINLSPTQQLLGSVLHEGDCDTLLAISKQGAYKLKVGQLIKFTYFSNSAHEIVTIDTLKIGQITDTVSEL